MQKEVYGGFPTVIHLGTYTFADSDPTPSMTFNDDASTDNPFMDPDANQTWYWDAASGAYYDTTSPLNATIKLVITHLTDPEGYNWQVFQKVGSQWNQIAAGYLDTV